MAKIIITIDGDNVTVNQSAAPTKMEKENKKFFIIMRYCNYTFDEQPYVEFVSDNYNSAINKLKCLNSSDNEDYYYKLLMQDENESIIPCNDTAWDID